MSSRLKGTVKFFIETLVMEDVSKEYFSQTAIKPKDPGPPILRPINHEIDLVKNLFWENRHSINS